MILQSTRVACLVSGLLLGNVTFGPLAYEPCSENGTPFEAGCPGTIRFTGGGGTSQWELAANWDAGRLPTWMDDVCIPAPFSVDLSSGAYQAGTLYTEAGSALAIQGGTLGVVDRSDLYGELRLASGILDGNGVVVAHGPFTWSGGTMKGPGTTVTDALTIEGDDTKALTNARTLRPEGTTVWTGGGSLSLQGGCKIQGAGSWEARSDAPLLETVGAGPALFEIDLDTAAFRKSAGAGTKVLGVRFTNAGTTRLEAGTMELTTAGGQFLGPFIGSPGTVLRVSSGSYTAGSLSAGTLIADGGTLIADGPGSVSDVQVSSGTATLGATEVGTLTLTGGTAGAATVAHLVQSGGTLAGDVTVTGPLEWTAGTMKGPGTTRAMAGVTLSGTVTKTLSAQRVLETRGTTVCTGPLQVQLGTTLRNHGSFELPGATLTFSGPTSRFENMAGATFRKTSSGSLQLAPYVNDGTILLDAGTLAALGGGMGNGSVVGSQGTRLQFLGSSPHAWGPDSSITGVELTVGTGSVTLAGTVSVPSTRVVTGAILDLQSTASIAALGALDLSNGTLRVPYAATATTHVQSSTGSLAVGIRGPGQNDRLNVAGQAQLGGTLEVALLGGYVPGAGDTFTLLTFSSAAGTFAATSLPPLPAELTWRLHYDPTAVILEATADADGDGVDGPHDCAPLDPSAWAVPDEVAGFAIGADQTMSWTSQAASAGTGTVYDAVRGLTSELPVGTGGETCLAAANGTAQLGDGTTPAVGACFYYLVRAKNACGIGTYGTGTGGAERTTTACP